jgi:DNA-binding beta-propeller fold protein YncE
LASLLWVSCGDTYRPVVIPNQPIPINPRNSHAVFAITTNGPFNPGSGMQIDVSGDTTAAVVKAGRGPVFAALTPSPVHLITVNEGEDTLTIFLPSISGLPTATTITLPAGSSPVFATTAEANNFYVANPGNDTVSFVNALSNENTFNVAFPAGSKPVGLAEMPNARKVYVVNQGTNSVQSINVVDRSLNPAITDPTISSPVWAVARQDSSRVYVLSQGNGDLVEIDTDNDTLLSNGISAGAGANYLFYDSPSNRIYITNPVAGTVTIAKIDVDPPVLLATLPVAQVHSIAALADGSRAYAVSSLVTGSNAASTLTVINTISNTLTKTITFPTVAANSNCASVPYRVSVAAAADSTRVYVANCDAGNVAVINTMGDALVVDLPAPVSAANPLPGQTYPPPQNPVYMLAGP